MFTGFKSAAATYAQVDLESRVAASNPHGLIEMLFDGAIMAVGQADQCLAAGDPRAKGQAVSRAIRIIEEGLKASLDPSSGGELARHLGELYDYMAQRLLMASIKNEAEGFQEVRKLLVELRGAWTQINGEQQNRDAAALASVA
jgi:flagellar secretion chaperone FliS